MKWRDSLWLVLAVAAGAGLLPGGLSGPVAAAASATRAAGTAAPSVAHGSGVSASSSGWGPPGVVVPPMVGSSTPGYESDAGTATALPPVVEGTCVEHVPAGKTKPKLRENFPARGLAGYALTLEVAVEHGKGETVMPDGFRAGLGSEQSKRLAEAGFTLPEPDGGAGYDLRRTEQGERATTTVRVPFLALPSRPGRQNLVLPPVPIALARASGDVITLCTEPHAIAIDEPIANLPHPVPQPNPPPRRQLEEWTLLKHVTSASLVALLVGALVAWLLGKWLRRPRQAPPPPPPRPPWEVAMEELHDLRHAGLIEQQRFAEHFDRSSYSVRKYLGGRYGFDGLESTTREILQILRRVVPPVAPLVEIQAFLRQADLVKFARLTPSPDDCRVALERGEDIVQRTVPVMATLSSGESSPGFPAEQLAAGALVPEPPLKPAPEATGSYNTVLPPVSASEEGQGPSLDASSIAGESPNKTRGGA